jgi:hypothetical protein
LFVHGSPHPPGYTQLLEQAGFVRARHHVAGLGMGGDNLALNPDPTDYAGKTAS